MLFGLKTYIFLQFSRERAIATVFKEAVRAKEHGYLQVHRLKLIELTPHPMQSAGVVLIITAAEADVRCPISQ